LKKKTYGFPLLRRQFLKTRFAWKRKKVREKQGPIFPHLEIHHNSKNVKCKSFLKKKRYGIPLLRMQFSKTRFAWKRKKVRGKPSAHFSTSGNPCHNFKSSKNVKMKSFLNEKSYGNPLLRMQKSKTGFARNAKKSCAKTRPNFSTSGNILYGIASPTIAQHSFL
jgi:hypothetical protein